MRHSLIARQIAVAAIAVVLSAVATTAQRGGGPPGQRGGGPPAPPTPRAAAPIDLTGYWVSQITEDWRYRVATAPKGDYQSVPLNPAGRKAADSWDPSRDEAAGEQCKAYGVGGVMRLPGRLHVTWQDDRTLNIATEAGTQTRTLRFGADALGRGAPPADTSRPALQTDSARPAAAAQSDWQGFSQASWDRMQGPMGAGILFGGGGFGVGGGGGGSLRVVTRGMKPGYLRRNGVPYSADAVITEYFDRFDLPDGDALMVVSTEVIDPAYLTQPFWTSTHFRKQRDATGWNPTPCKAR